MCIFNCGFPNDLLFGVYFVFILEYRNNVRQKTKFKQLIWVQNGSQAEETTFNINITFGLELLTANIQCNMLAVVQEVL